MKRLQVKANVVANIKREFAIKLGWLARDWEANGMGPLIITSLKDGSHRPGSDHKQDQPATVPGEAADIRTWHWWVGPANRPQGKAWMEIGHHQQKLIDYCARLQQNGFKVHLHPDWDNPGSLTTPHLHIALKEFSYETVS